MDLSEDIDRIRSLVHGRDLAALSDLAQRPSVRRLVEVVQALPIDDAAVVYRLLDKERATAVFDDLDTATQADLVSELGHTHLADAFAGLDADELARLLDELPARVAKLLVTAIPEQNLTPAMTLLGYPQGSVGRQMTPVTMRAAQEETVGDVLARLRTSSWDTEDLVTIPVLTADRILVGTLDPFELMRHEASAPVSEVMDPDPAVAHTQDSAERVARRVLDRGTLLLPVLDREHRLVGTLPIAEAARIDKAAVAEDQARAGAREPLRRPYLLTPIRTVTRSRIVWLLVLAISAVLTVQVLELFEATLSQQVTLALFIPLLTGIGGNTGSQAATTVTRALALGDVRLRDLPRVAFKEVRTGLMLGLLLGALAFVVASWIYGTGIGTVIAVTLVLNIPIAATVGGVIPLVARACRVDPAVFSTPFISTFCDASGLLVYFTVAISVLGL